MRKIRTVDTTSLLHDVAARHQLSKNSQASKKLSQRNFHIRESNKAFSIGLNPVQDTALPDGAEVAEQYAYSVEEIEAILNVLLDPAATIFAAAAYAGFRRSELRGLRWEEYRDRNQSGTRRMEKHHRKDSTCKRLEPRQPASCAQTPL